MLYNPRVITGMTGIPDFTVYDQDPARAGIQREIRNRSDIFPAG
jgi:hypothetical protein